MSDFSCQESMRPRKEEGARKLISRRTFLLGAASLSAIGLSLPAEAALTDFEPFAFGYVTDCHLANGMPDSYKLVHESQLFLQDVIKELNKENLAFVIFGGDQVEVVGRDETNWQLFLDVASGLNCPWNFVLGECDVTDQFPVDKMRTFGPDWKGKGIETNTSYWSQNPLPGVHIIGLDTSRPNSATGDMSRRQLEWLQKDLKANRMRFTIVFSHHPLLPPPPYDSGPPWDEYILPAGPSVREVIAGSPKVRLAISGHVHAAKIQREKEIWYASCPSLNVYPCAYRIFRVTPDTVTMETYQVGFEALVKKARKNLEASSMAYKFDPAKPERFVELLEGDNIDNDAMLPLVGATTAQALPKRKKKKSKGGGKKEKPKKEKKKKEKEPAKEKPKTQGKPESKREDKGSAGKSEPPAKTAPEAEAPAQTETDNQPETKEAPQSESGKPEFQPADSTGKDSQGSGSRKDK